MTAAPSSIPRLSAAMVVAAASHQGRYDYRVLFLQRSSRTSTFSSFHVFPGGVIDAEDTSSSWLPLLKDSGDKISQETGLKLVWRKRGCIVGGQDRLSGCKIVLFDS